MEGAGGGGRGLVGAPVAPDTSNSGRVVSCVLRKVWLFVVRGFEPFFSLDDCHKRSL